MKSGETIVKPGENMLFTRFHKISPDYSFICWSKKYYQMNFNPNLRAFGSKSPRSNSSNMPVFKGKPCKKVAAKKKSCKKTTAKQEPLKKKANNRGTKIGAFAKKGKLSKEKSECKESPKKVKSPAAFEKRQRHLRSQNSMPRIWRN